MWQCAMVVAVIRDIASPVFYDPKAERQHA